MDTSALISLQMTGLLKIASENIDIVLTQLVVEELKELKQYNDQVGRASEEVLHLTESGSINIINISKDVEDIQSSSVDEGEASCFVLAKKNKIRNLVMDDIKAASTLEELAIKEGIRQRISVAVIKELLNEDIISKEEAKRVVKEMIKDRGWKGGVLEVLAEEYLYAE